MSTAIMLPGIESPTTSSSQRTGCVGLAGLLTCCLGLLSSFHPQIRGRNWLRVTADSTSAWQEKAKSAGRTVGVGRDGCRNAYWDLTAEEKRRAEVLVVWIAKPEKNRVSQVWTANKRPFIRFIESYGSDNLAYVTCEPNNVQQRVIDQESPRRAAAHIEEWLGVKGGRPGEEIEPPADALIAKMHVSAIVSWVLLTVDVNILRNKRMRNWDRVDHLTDLERTDLDNAFKRSSIVASM